MADLVRNYWLNEIVLVLRGKLKEYPPGRPGDKTRERKIMLVLESLDMIINPSIAIVACSPGGTSVSRN